MTGKEYKIQKWTDDIFQFQDHYGYCAILIVGSKEALLFDTMSGEGDLIGEIRKITELPVTVVNSHGHLDHTAGSIGLYCEDKKLLFSGDALSPQMCMFFKESLTTEDYLNTINRISLLDFEYFITSHHIKLFPKTILKKFAQCTELKKNGVRGTSYEYSINPEIKGRAYFLEYQNKETGEIICYIDKAE